MNSITQDILSRIATHPNNPTAGGLNFAEREVVLAELKVNSHETRELSKRLKDKRDTTCVVSSPVELVDAIRSENNTTTATTSVTNNSADTSIGTRVDNDITGISVQHSRPTKKVKLAGIKVMVNVQMRKHVATKEVIKLTAELKRYERIYEVKTKEGDSPEFPDFLEDTKRMIREAEAKHYCLGRLHNRGKRSEWYADSFVVGILNDSGVLVQVIINLEGQEFVIEMDKSMSALQELSYYSNGVYGVIATGQKTAPRLCDAPTSRL